jgi:hypothetical protein
VVAALRDSRSTVVLDAVLNLVWPGLGQLNQGRSRVAACFALEAAGLVALFGLFPASRLPIGVTIVAITIWSMAEVVIAARRG